MNVSLKTFMPVAAAGLLGLSACSHVEERAKDYMQDKPYSEFVELTNTSNMTLIQSRLDSLAYRDILTVQSLRMILLLLQNLIKSQPASEGIIMNMIVLKE